MFVLFSCMILWAAPALVTAETVIIAHRGAFGLAPENTLAAFAKAVEIGAEYFELDVQLSSDDSLMLMHDNTIDRTTSGSGALVTQTYTQLRSVDAGSWFSPAFAGEKIPTLSEALAASNTIACWDLDEAEGGTMHDGSRNNNQGTLMNDLDWGAGHSGNALVFDGVNDYAAIPSSTSLDINTNAVSISLWTRLELLPNDLPGSYGPLYDSDTDNYVLYEDKGTNELRFKVTTDKSAERPGIPASDLKTGEWLHVVGVYDGSQAMIFLNGQRRDTHPLTGIVRAKQRATIGASAGSYFKGAIDDIQIFSRALTEDEIQCLYTGVKPVTYVEKHSEMPEQNSLAQNYPNPFNTSTAFYYTVSKRGKVRLSVYDVLGHEVVRLIDRVQDRGSYAAKWDTKDRNGSPASSGIYFCTLTTDHGAIQRKIVLAR